MSMCSKHINTHRNPGADVNGIIAYLFPFYKRCQNFLKFFGILNPFLQKRVKPPEAFSWRLVDSVCLIQTGVCVFIAHAPGFSFCKFADQERKPPSDEGGGTAKP